LVVILLPLVALGCATNVGGGSSPGSGGTNGGGTAGTSGSAGTSGAGTAGTTGSAGTPGSAGTVGTSGSAGTVGTTGSAGTTGTAGTTASAGTTGTGGRGGTTGTAGTTASAGTTGTGTAGTTGGTAGTFGAAGTTGTLVDGGAGQVDLNGKRALYVVDDPSSLDAGDVILQMSLQIRGMVVTFAPSTGPASLATGQNVVIVSSGAGAGDFAPVFKDVPVPMIVFGNSAYQNLGWIPSSSKGSVNSTTLASLVDASTTLSSDIMAGVGFKMILDIRSTSLYWGTPGGSPIKVASIMGSPSELVVFAFEKGAAMATGTAAARRVGFGVKTDSIQDVTIEGFKLLTAAIEWTAGSS
jgi:hypothetical protein